MELRRQSPDDNGQPSPSETGQQSTRQDPGARGPAGDGSPNNGDVQHLDGSDRPSNDTQWIFSSLSQFLYPEPQRGSRVQRYPVTISPESRQRRRAAIEVALSGGTPNRPSNDTRIGNHPFAAVQQRGSRVRPYLVTISPESRQRRRAAIEVALSGGAPNNNDQRVQRLGGGDRPPANSTRNSRIGNHPIVNVPQRNRSGLRGRPRPTYHSPGDHRSRTAAIELALDPSYRTIPASGTGGNRMVNEESAPRRPSLSQDEINTVIAVYRALEALKHRDAAVQTDHVFLLSRLSSPIKGRSGRTPMSSTAQTQFPASSISGYEASGSSQARPKIKAVIVDSDDETDAYRRLPRYPSENDIEVDAANPRVLPNSDGGSLGSLSTSRCSSPLDFPSSQDENMQADDKPHPMDTQQTLVPEHEIDWHNHDDIYEPEVTSSTMQGPPTDMDLSEDEFQDACPELDPKALDLIPELNALPNKI